MFKKISIFILLLIPVLYLSTISFVMAADDGGSTGGLVPCGNDPNNPCGYDDLISLIGRMVNFALYNIALPLSIVMIIWGGILILSSGGNESKVKKGKDIITGTFVGIAIAFGAWLIVHTVIEIFFK